MEINTILAPTPTDAACLGTFDLGTSLAVIIVCCVLGIAWAIFNYILVKKINVHDKSGDSSKQLINDISDKQRELLIELGDKISAVTMVSFRVLLSS